MRDRVSERKWFLFAATAVLLLAAGFRLVALQDMPPGLSQDEVFNAGMPAFILQGNHALFFKQAFGHEPLYHYLSIPFYLLFGENYLEIRLLSAFLGILLTAVTMGWARREYGSITAVVAGLGLAVSWWAVIFSRVGIRPIMQPLFWVTAAWFWQKRPWLAGLLLGLSLYTYTGAQVTFFLPLLYGLGRFLFSQDRAGRVTAVKNSLIILGVTILISLPLYLTWYADPTLLQRVDQLGGPLDALRRGEITPIIQASLNTLGVFGITGDPRWTYALPGRPLFDPLTAVLFAAGFIMAFWKIRRPEYTLLLTFLLVGLIPSMLTPESPSTIRMIGAMPFVFILLGMPFSWLFQNLPSKHPRWRPVLLIFLLGFLLLNMGRTWQTAVAWSTDRETRLNHYQTVLLEIGRHWQANPTENVIVADKFFEAIDAASLNRNMGHDGQARWLQAGPDVAGAFIFPGGSGNGRLYVPEFAPINPDLLRETGLSATPDFRSETVPSFSIYNLPAQLPEPEVSTNVTFDGRVQLTGYTLLPATENGSLQLYSYWQVLQPLPWNLTTFVHLIDAQGNLISQHDGLDAAPDQLQPGDHFIQLHLLEAPSEDALYTLRLGLYTPDNGLRLLTDGESLGFYTLEHANIFDGK